MPYLLLLAFIGLIAFFSIANANHQPDISQDEELKEKNYWVAWLVFFVWFFFDFLQ